MKCENTRQNSENNHISEAGPADLSDYNSTSFSNVGVGSNRNRVKRSISTPERKRFLMDVVEASMLGRLEGKQSERMGKGKWE